MRIEVDFELGSHDSDTSGRVAVAAQIFADLDSLGERLHSVNGSLDIGRIYSKQEFSLPNDRIANEIKNITPGTILRDADWLRSAKAEAAELTATETNRDILAALIS